MKDLDVVLDFLKVVDWFVLRWLSTSSSGHFCVDGSDLDLFVPTIKISTFVDFLYNKYFSIKKKGYKRTHAYKYLSDWSLLFLDIIDDIDTDINTYFNLTLDPTFKKKLFSSPKLYKDDFNLLRYLVNFKQNKESFLLDFWDISKEDINLKLERPLLKRDIPISYISSLLKRNIFFMFKYFCLQYLFQYYWARLLQMSKRFFSWKVFIFLWPDWVWKTTLISRLSQDFWFKTYYLWKLNTYYKDLILNWDNRKLYQIVWKFIILLFLYYTSYLNIFLDVCLGNYVLVDRCDKYTLWLSSHHKKVFNFLSWLFVVPPKTHLVGVGWDPIVIQLRKKENSVESTSSQILEVNNIIDRKWGFYLDNLHLPDSLNKILSYIYSIN